MSLQKLNRRPKKTFFFRCPNHVHFIGVIFTPVELFLNLHFELEPASLVVVVVIISHHHVREAAATDSPA